MALFVRKNNLRKIRKEKKLSGYDLQLLTNIPAQSIYLIERGIKRPARHERHLISDALGLSVDSVFPDDLRLNDEVEEL
jgi:transcriptional regulator with XRE-family HTH domain